MRKVLYILGLLSDDDVEWLATMGQRQSVKPGQILVTQGQPLDWLYFILDGRFCVTASGVGELATIGCGEIIGEISLIDSHLPAASVSALEEGTVLAVAREQLQAKLTEDLAFAAHFYHAIATFLAARMRQTVKQLGQGDAHGHTTGHEDHDNELDLNRLDGVHLASAKFDRILKRFQR